MSYNFEAVRFSGLETETTPSNKRVGGDDVPTSLSFPAVSDYFRYAGLKIALGAVWRNHDKYRGRADTPEEAGAKRLLKVSIWRPFLKRICCGSRQGRLVM